MRKYRPIFLYVMVCCLLSCSRQETELTELPFEKYLFPEGIAIDGKTKKVYLNSLKSNKIVSSLLDGTHPETFLETNKYGYLAGFGMTIKGDTLYALGNSLTGEKNSSILLLVQLSSGTLIDTYSINDTSFHYWNDLAISSKNEIFITDSESNKVYKIQRPTKVIEVYLDNESIPNSNGIAISDDDQYIYLASTKGICIVEISSKKLQNTPKEVHAGIDGLKFHRNNLYGIANAWVSDKSKNGLFKYHLDTEQTGILNSQKIVAFNEGFRVPTTFAIDDGNLYFIMNTQLDNFDAETNEVLDSNSLASYMMMKIKVE